MTDLVADLVISRFDSERPDVRLTGSPDCTTELDADAADTRASLMSG